MRLASALVACVLLALGSAAAAEEDAAALFHATTLNVSADGEARAVPDMATITIGVQTDAPSAAQAFAANSRQMNAAIDTLKAQGVPPRDIATSNLTLEPQYVFHDNEPRRLTGYQASNTVRVTVRDLAKLGGVVDAVVGSGANQISGIEFGLQHADAAADAAREDAVRALQAKAQLYAHAIGLKLGRLVSLSETGGSEPVQPRMRQMLAAAPMRKTPVEAGELSIHAGVAAVYELAR